MGFFPIYLGLIGNFTLSVSLPPAQYTLGKIYTGDGWLVLSGFKKCHIAPTTDEFIG